MSKNAIRKAADLAARMLPLAGCALAAGIALTSCSHSANIVGNGKVIRCAADGATYVNGFFAYTEARENSEVVITTEDGDAFGTSGNARGLRTICFRTGPQISGYLVELAEQSPEAAMKYMENMAELNYAQWGPAESRGLEPSVVEGVSARPASEGGADGGDAPAEAGRKDGACRVKDAFTCTGDCDYADLSAHSSCDYLLSAVEALSKYDCTAVHGETGEPYSKSLSDLGKIAAKYKGCGLEDCIVRIKSVTVRDGKVTALKYAWVEDGSVLESECPACVNWEAPLLEL